MKNFLGNKKAENYKEMVREMLDAFRDMNVNMSLKIHILYDHLDYFPNNLGDFSDEHGERFHKDIALIEQRFKRKNTWWTTIHMMGEYCWSICRDSSQQENKRQTSQKKIQQIKK